MEFLLLGLNHRTAPLEVRERAAFSSEQALLAEEGLRASGKFREVVILSTCNRTELYAVPAKAPQEAEHLLEEFLYSFSGLSIQSLDGALYSLRNLEAARHLFRVAAGLDSMLLGEAEILGQVRQAYMAALERGTTGPVLNRLFQSALEAGKRVRAETGLGTRPMSAAFAAVKLAEQIFGKPKNHSALMVGAGAMGEQIVEHLRERGASRILICNRTRPRAAALAAKVGGEVVEWEELPRSLALPDMAVVSVQGEQAIVTSAMLQRALEARHGRPLFIVDLSVPRAVEEAAGRLNNIYLYNVDDLAGIVEQNRQARMEEIPRAERIIEEQLKRFRAWQAGSECASLVPELRARLRQEGDRVQREDLPELEHLSPEERQRARRAARPLRNAADLER